MAIKLAKLYFWGLLHKQRIHFIFFSSLKKDDLNEFYKNSDYFVVCIGSELGMARYFISKELEKKNIAPLNIISKNAYCENKMLLGKGIQVFPNSIIQTNTTTILKLFITILRLSSSSRQPVPAARARNTQRVALSSGLSFELPPALFLFPRSREEKREKIKEERKEKEKWTRQKIEEEKLTSITTTQITREGISNGRLSPSRTSPRFSRNTISKRRLEPEVNYHLRLPCGSFSAFDFSIGGCFFPKTQFFLFSSLRNYLNTGFATVMRAIEKDTGAEVAIKVRNE